MVRLLSLPAPINVLILQVCYVEVGCYCHFTGPGCAEMSGRDFIQCGKRTSRCPVGVWGGVVAVGVMICKDMVWKRSELNFSKNNDPPVLFSSR